MYESFKFGKKVERRGKVGGRGGKGEEKEVVCILPDTQTQKEKKTKEDQLLDLQLVSLISERLPLSSEKIQHL